MKRNADALFSELFDRYPVLIKCKDRIWSVYVTIRHCYLNKGKLLICGNGGSAADSEHITGELMKGFFVDRRIPESDIEKLRNLFPDDWKYLSENLQRSLPAIPLSVNTAFITAYMNDIMPDMVFAQQVFGYAVPCDCFLGISTSGNAQSVINAAKVARSLGLSTIALTGKDGGKLAEISDMAIMVPEVETYKVQELHMPVYHILCAMLEADFFGCQDE
jgi:D-sedoheptulose 7-phosphate isomerase